ESVSRAGKGYSQFATNTERMDEKIHGMLKIAIKPSIKDYNITWTDQIIEVSLQTETNTCSILLDPVILQGSKIHTLAARKLIHDLENETSFIHKHPKNSGKTMPNSLI
ncbi:20815_t:CDS:2, partial [Racocetra persica]